jgi:hypothetical protein
LPSWRKRRERPNHRGARPGRARPHRRQGQPFEHQRHRLAPELYPLIVEQLDEARIAAAFADRRPSRVTRYLLPNLHAINVVLDDVLDGGVNDALNLDSHGKTLAYRLLELPIEVPPALAHLLAGPPAAPAPDPSSISKETTP